MPERLLFEGGTFEPVTGRLELDGRASELRPRTAAVLACLLAASGRVVTRKELFDTVWHDAVVGDESLGQCIKEIRHALGDRAGRIRTVPRIGYAFTGGVREPAPFSVLVLPFRAQPSGLHVADAITDALTTDLSRISGCFVIAHATAAALRGEQATPQRVRAELGVRYLLEGAVQVEAPWLQVDARLVDTEDSRVAWSERLATPTLELEALSFDIVGRLARALHLQIIDAEARRAARRPPAEAGAYDLAMRGWSLWNRHTAEANRQARVLFEQAVARDPAAAMAWAGLANTYVSDVFLTGASMRDMLPLARRAADQGYAQDPAHTSTQGALATVLAMQGQLREARVLLESLLRGNPNYAPALLWLAIVLVQSDDPARALGQVRLARRLSPRDPRLAYILATEGRTLLHLDCDEEAITVLREAASQPNLGYAALPLLAGALSLRGNMDEARRTAHACLAARPGFRLAAWRAWIDACAPRAKERETALLAAAAAAGLPQ